MGEVEGLLNALDNTLILGRYGGRLGKQTTRHGRVIGAPPSEFAEKPIHSVRVNDIVPSSLDHGIGCNNRDSDPHDRKGGGLDVLFPCNLARRPQSPVNFKWFSPRPFSCLDPLLGLEWSLLRHGTLRPLGTLEGRLQPPDTSHGGFCTVAGRGLWRLSRYYLFHQTAEKKIILRTPNSRI